MTTPTVSVTNPSWWPWRCDYCGQLFESDCTKSPITYTVYELAYDDPIHEWKARRVGVLGTVAYRGHGDSEDAYEWARNEVEQQYGERFRDVDHLWWELVPVVGKAVRRQRCTTPSTRSRR